MIDRVDGKRCLDGEVVCDVGETDYKVGGDSMDCAGWNRRLCCVGTTKRFAFTL